MTAAGRDRPSPAQPAQHLKAKDRGKLLVREDRDRVASMTRTLAARHAVTGIASMSGRPAQAQTGESTEPRRFLAPGFPLILRRGLLQMTARRCRSVPTIGARAELKRERIEHVDPVGCSGAGARRVDQRGGWPAAGPPGAVPPYR